jgi:hypothetical protein
MMLVWHAADVAVACHISENGVSDKNSKTVRSILRMTFELVPTVIMANM